MNMPDMSKVDIPNMSKVDIPKRGIVFLVYIYCIRDVVDIKVAMIITVAFLVYTIAQTITDLKGKQQEISP